jgi:hypothetical protein
MQASPCKRYSDLSEVKGILYIWLSINDRVVYMYLHSLYLDFCLFVCLNVYLSMLSVLTCTKSHIHFLSLSSFIQGIRPGPRLCECFCYKLIFYGEELLAPRPTPKLEDHPLSAVHDCLFNIFAAFNSLNIFLHETLLPYPNITLIAFFF